MAIKKVYKMADVLPRVYSAVDMVNDPVRQTLSPKGGNVIYEDEKGNQFYSNDGVTIMNSIVVKGDVENAIIEILKGGSRKTNLEAGDGTSSTLLMSSVLVKEGLKLVENGHNQIDVRDQLTRFAEDMKKELKKKVIPVKDDKELKFIAKISASNDEDIASDVVKIIKIVGEDGHVILDRGFTPDTEIIEDAGFVVRAGAFAPELVNKQFQAQMNDVPVLITDKRLYYKAEAETILNTVLKAGYNEVVIIAQDFIGEALPFFIANHQNNKVRVILVAEKKLEILEDLATYIGTEVVSDKKGNLVDKITIDSFALSKKVFTDPTKTIIARDKKEKNPDLDERIKTLKAQLKKNGNKQDGDYTNIQRRISSLTNGMVTIKVGGDTPLEIIEKLHRYEDAINAARGAMKEGYLPGAGVAVHNAFKKLSFDADFERVFGMAADINIRQIAENCGKNPDSILEKIDDASEGFGYNANNGKIEDVVKAGIIEPFLVTSQVIANAVSIANIIITSRFLVVNDIEDYKENNKN